MEPLKAQYFHNYAAQLAIHAEELVSIEKVRELLNFTENEYVEFKNGKRELDCIAFSNFAFELGFSLDTFLNKNIDVETVKEHAKGNLLALPKKYSLGANSKIVSFNALLSEVERLCGVHVKNAALRNLQVHPELLSHYENKINYKAFDDLFSYLIDRGLDNSVVTQFGLSAVNNLKKSDQIAMLENSKDLASLYETFFAEVIVKLEENNLYKITKMTTKYIEVESQENPKMLDIFHVKHIGKNTRCSYRAGILQGLSTIIKPYKTEVVEEKCVHRGDKCCVFKIYF